jgi:hypothetical protein
MTTQHLNSWVPPKVNTVLGHMGAKHIEKNEKPPVPSKVIGDLSNYSTKPDSASFKPDEEAFTSLASQFDPTGHSLHHVKHSNSFYAERWGHARYFSTLDDAREFLVQIGGNHG